MEVSRALLFELGVLLAVLAVLGSGTTIRALPPIPVYLLAGLSLAMAASSGRRYRYRCAHRCRVVAFTLGLEFSATELLGSLRHYLPSAGVDNVQRHARCGGGLAFGVGRCAILGLLGSPYISSSVRSRGC